MAKQSLDKVRPNPKNPRKVTDAKLKMLRESLARFGDLSGIVVNRTTGLIVGGHQRIKAFKDLGASEVTLTKEHSKPTAAGTVAEGFVDIGGERYSYRETEWSTEMEKAANLAANKSAGEWNLSQVAEWVDELSKIDFDLGLTMFDTHEREMLTYELPAPASVQKLPDGPEFDMPSERGKALGQDEDSSLDDAEVDISKYDNLGNECPRCGFHFESKKAG